MGRRRRERNVTPASIVTSLYTCMLGREPVGGEELNKVAYLEDGGSLEQLLELILASPECQLSHHFNPAFLDLLAPEPLRPEVPRLYLWHIPKTGGTSLREMLRPHFADLEFCGSLPLGSLYRLSNYRLRSFRVIAGHFGPMVPQLISDVALVTATLIRDPVDVIASFYVHWRDYGWPDHAGTALARRFSFADWCRSDDTSIFWSNPQARQLASLRIPPDREQARVSPEGEMVHIPDIELADLAPQMLESIDIVGTSDDLLLVYRECLRRLGMVPAAQAARAENVGRGLGEAVSAATRDWLLEHNTVDLALFDRANIRGGELRTISALR
jgi:hypothetical protein